MKGEKHRLRQAAGQTGGKIKEMEGQRSGSMISKVMNQSVIPKNLVGVNSQVAEGMYAQAYRYYNTGKYDEACHLFRLLVMLDSTEPKYMMGLAACFHMMKNFRAAVETYTLCSVIDPQNPVPHYHASDCFIQMNDKASALVALQMTLKRTKGKPEYQTMRDRVKMSIASLKKELHEKGQDGVALDGESPE